MTAVWRWRTSGVPTWGGRPAGAFMPMLTFTAGTWQGFKGWLTGQPGTQAVPAPNLDIPDGDRYAVGEGVAYRRDFGGAWYPDLWYQQDFSTWFGARAGNGTVSFAAGVQVHSDNQLPVPAIEPTRGTYRYGGGQVVPVYQNPFRRAQTKRTVQPRNA